ncbi:MAG: CAP domain-containing protein [Rhodocyclaceae bacterium]|nr:MAG: CAP domain-containing protein [Rhodocyclaceae bacterium]
MRGVMHLRSLAALLLLAVCFGAVAGDLYTTINHLREGEGGCGAAKQLPPLQPQAALERVARDLAQGNKLEQSLAAAGYRATRVKALTFSGDRIGARVAEILATQNYCQQLQDAAMTEAGTYVDARQVWIVIAAPFAPSVEMAGQTAGQRVLDLVNEARSTRRNCGNKAFNEARPVSWNDILAEASRLHAEDMAHFNYLDHGGRDGSTPALRVERAGYRYRAMGENIAGGQTKPEDAVTAWIKSPPHCANLMNPAFTEMGVAFAVDRTSKLGVYWAQEFGAPR